MAQIDNVYGVDVIMDDQVGLRVGPNGDYAEVNGIQNITNWIYHCLITNPGDYRMRPTYGCGVPSYVKQKMTTSNLRKLQNDIVSNLLFDPRITQASAGLQLQSINGVNVLLINIQVIVNGQKLNIQPFSFGGN